MANTSDAEKIVVKSHGNSSEQTMTVKEFEDFQKVVDPQKKKFYNAGPFAPEEVSKPDGKAKGPAAATVTKDTEQRTSAAN